MTIKAANNKSFFKGPPFGTCSSDGAIQKPNLAALRNLSIAINLVFTIRCGHPPRIAKTRMWESLVPVTLFTSLWW